MSYDIRIKVRVADADHIFAVVAKPEHDSPTYNLAKMFRVCTGWDFEQGKEYKCIDVIDNIIKGINELKLYPAKYKKYEPDNGWGTIESAILSLESMRDCIYETAENIPIECLYVSW